MKRVDRIVRRIANKRRGIISNTAKDLLGSEAVFGNLKSTVGKTNLPKIVNTKEDLKSLEQISRLSKFRRAKQKITRRLMLARAHLQKSSKFIQIRQTFGKQGERAGIMIVKPELFGYSNRIRGFLNSLGFDVVFVKNVLLDKKMIYDVFGGEFKKEYNFPVEGAYMRASPSKVLVFKLLSRQQMYKKSKFLRELKKQNFEEYKKIISTLNGMTVQEVFSTLIKGRYYGPVRGSLRNEVVNPFLDRIKSENEGNLAGLLDAFGYFKGNKFKGAPKWTKNNFLWFTGAHAPSDPKELFLAANALLSKGDLIKLNRYFPL